MHQCPLWVISGQTIAAKILRLSANDPKRTSSCPVILVHNHPSGDPTLSAADIEMTKRIARAAEPLGVVPHDHIIVGRDRHASLRKMKLI